MGDQRLKKESNKLTKERKAVTIQKYEYDCSLFIINCYLIEKVLSWMLKNAINKREDLIQRLDKRMSSIDSRTDATLMKLVTTESLLTEKSSSWIKICGNSR